MDVSCISLKIHDICVSCLYTDREEHEMNNWDKLCLNLGGGGVWPICTNSIFILILELFAEYFEIQTLSRLRLWIV